jgi:hypothetical protein
MRKNTKGLKIMKADVDAAISRMEKAKASGDPETWTAIEDATLTLLRCFKYVFDHGGS